MKDAVIIFILVTLIQSLGIEMAFDSVFLFGEESRLLDTWVQGATLDEWVKNAFLDVKYGICLLAGAKHERETVDIVIREGHHEWFLYVASCVIYYLVDHLPVLHDKHWISASTIPDGHLVRGKFYHRLDVIPEEQNRLGHVVWFLPCTSFDVEITRDGPHFSIHRTTLIFMPLRNVFWNGVIAL